MATQRQRLQQQMLNAGNLGFNKPLPVDLMIAPNVAPAARSGLTPTPNISTTTSNPNTAAEIERAHLRGLIQRGVRVTRFRG